MRDIRQGVNLLDELTEAELKTILMDLKPGEIDQILQPFRTRNKNNDLSSFTKLLGNLDKNSILVKRNLPGVMLKLYKLGRHPFVEFVNEKAETVVGILMQGLEQMIGEEPTNEKISKMSAEEIVSILKKYDSLSNENNIDARLFFVQCKLAGFTISDEVQEDVIKTFEPTEIQEAITVITPKPEISKPIIKKDKPRKKTAEEKAAATKAARKRLEQQQEAKTEEIEEINIINKDSEIEISRKEVEREEKSVSLYVGKVTKQGSFYNFKPLALYNGKTFESLTAREIDDLLPLSQKRNINLFYNPYDSTDFMEDNFYEDELYFFDFTVDELEENRFMDGSINPTGYKVKARDVVAKGKIRPISQDGFYLLKSKEVLSDDIESSKIIRINYPRIHDNERILIRIDSDFIIGPFTVKYRPTADDYYIRSLVQENKYILEGYYEADYEINSIDELMEDFTTAERWTVYKLNDNALPIQRDIITDEELFSSFMENISKASGKGLTDDEINQYITTYKNSVYTGENIPEDISESRLTKIRDMLASETQLTSATDNIADLLFNLILNNKEDSRTNEILEKLVQKDGFIDSVQSMRIIKDRVEKARQELEQIESQKTIAKADVASKNESVLSEEKQQELSRILEKLDIANDALALEGKLKDLNKEIEYLERHKEHLNNDSRNLESQFVDLVNRYTDKMADVTFDGYMSSKMLQAAASWEDNNSIKKFDDKVQKINSIVPDELHGTELVDYIVNSIQVMRPAYDRNTIINLIVCSMQGFLTVFAGAPGCGKTSICNIIGKVLGLSSFNSKIEHTNEAGDFNRFIAVSVERGWTSKRDFVGYYNPLTKAFEESNRSVHDGLRLLNEETKKHINQYPFLILLDEANLSPMEYYWADFMNVCDDLEDNHSINLGNNNIFNIPETLHFLATINNDHTTETLSPRLIDRAWIVTLPKATGLYLGDSIDDSQLKNVSWEALKTTFVNSESEDFNFNNEVQKIYDELKKILNQADYSISPRVDIAIHKYCSVATRLMEDDEYNNSASIVALDYAIAQKVLPKIIGSGDDFADWLEGFKTFATSNNLMKTSELLTEMINRGNKQMKFFQFF